MKATQLAFGSFLFVALFAGASMAQVQRTFVSGLGNDGNPCSRTAPCRNFGQAISQTNAGGEVVVLDSAGYGPVTITRSVSLIAPPGVYAGISVFSGDGITINAGASDTVILRGLTVNNQGSGGSGLVFNTGVKLHVEGCVINGFSSANGLSLLAGGGARVEVIDSIVTGNSIGILVQPLSGSAQATIDHVRLEANLDGLSAREGSKVTVTNSVAASNGNDGLVALSLTSGSVQMNVSACVITSNLSFGIISVSLSTGVSTIRLSSSTVTGNGTGLQNSGSPAVLLSRGDNTVEGNTTDTSGAIGSYSGK